ncbi:MAG: xanthine dehydrogenase family protein molybdopterin-binding subunit [Burkholderiales bacterium]|nr:xanthine dehydrogenase family protein molybdopterin-binding subunit [Burkholderiales bacterium]
MQPSRREDLRLIQGQGRYAADWNLPGQLYAAVLRSPHAAARIRAIDTAAALAAPGVKAVLTCADVERAGYKSIAGGIATKDRSGQPMKKPFYPVLARDHVAHVGQAVAFVVADSTLAAQDAVELIAVDYEELTSVVTFADAVAPGAPRVHDEIEGNVAFVHEHGDAAATDAAFARARHVTKLTVDSQRLVCNPMEPRACLASYDAAAGRFTLHAPSQGLIGARSHIEQITGLSAKSVDLIVEDVGGSFGIRGTPYPEYFLAMLAAKELGRPVKWVGSRADTFLSDYHGRALSLTGEVALDEAGNFLAFRWSDTIDLGAYAGPFGAFIGTQNISITSHGVYKVPAVHVRSVLAYTNTTPISAYRGAGRPDIAYAIERLVDQAAHEHGFDPVALRQRNFIAPAQMPYKTATGPIYDSGDFPAVFAHALAAADHAGFSGRRAQSAARGRLRGIGFASYLEAAAAGVFNKDQTAARVGSDGVITIHCMAGGSGQGHETTFVGVFAATLGVPAATVQYRASDPAYDRLVGNGTGGSRTAAGQGSAFKALALALIEKATPLAAARLGTEAVTYAAGTFSGGGRSITLTELARALPPDADGNHPLDCNAETSSPATYPNGCHVAEVEIDPETGVAEVVRYTAVDDLGNVLQPVLVEGQVHGGVVQGVGQVFGEHAVYDRESGQFLTASFMDYPMPRAGWLKGSFTRESHPVPTATNLMGAKGVGESGCSGSLPALMNALMDAVRPAGVADLQMPVTPGVLWRTLNDAARKAA